KKRGEVIDVVTISPALGQVLDELATLRRPDCLYVFPTHDGNAYPERAFTTCVRSMPPSTSASAAPCPTCTRTRRRRPESTTETGRSSDRRSRCPPSSEKRVAV